MKEEKQIRVKVTQEIIDKMKDKLSLFAYYCEDPECCYGQVVSSMNELIEELEKEL